MVPTEGSQGWQPIGTRGGRWERTPPAPSEGGEPMVAKNVRSTRRYKKAVKDLRAKGDAYCWRGCGTYLYADLEWPHPLSITLGHIIALEDAPELFYDPDNHAPECIPCNMGDGARRTNAKRHGPERVDQAQPRPIRSSPHWE